MALLSKKYGAHLSESAKEALASCRSYLPGPAVKNPLIRNLARRIVQAEWEATLRQLDFQYTMEDEVVGDVRCVRYRTGDIDPKAPLILYLHAGAFIAGSARINASAILPLCRLGKCEGLGVEYSLAPEAVYPTQLDEVDRVYSALVNANPDRRIVMLGDSAGGTLLLAALHRWKKRCAPMPAGVILLSPVVDANGASDTYITLKSRDPIFNISGAEGIKAVFSLYAPEADLSDPEVSPFAGDFSGMPPAIIHVGSREVLLGDSARLAEKLQSAGCDVALRVFDGMFHLFHMHWSLSEAKAVHQSNADFIARLTA